MEKTKNDKKYHILCMAFTAAIILLFVLSLCIGKYPIDFGQLVSGTSTDLSKNVFWTLRFPRSVLSVLSGLALGLSGCCYQIIFRNPLASPDIIGVAGGANMGAATAIVLFSASGVLSVAAGAFLGGLFAALCVLLLVRAGRNASTGTFLLAGIVVNALTSAVIIALKYFADPANELASIEYWEMGTLGNVTASKLWPVLPFFALAFAGILVLRRPIVLMSLEDNESRSLGLRLKPTRIALIILNTLLVSSAICLTGLIAFVGLIAPHIARLILRRNDGKTLVLSSLIGAITVTGADILARSLATVELPISILTTVIVVPILVIFICRSRKRL